MSSLTWHCLHHSELDAATLYELLALRTQVFVVEQNCPYLETDGQDLVGDTCHLLARDESGLVGYLRLLDPQHMEGEVVIGRVLTAERARGTGLGHRLMERALVECGQRWPGGAGLSVGAGAPAGLLRALWLRGGDRGVSGGRHPAYRHAPGCY